MGLRSKRTRWDQPLGLVAVLYRKFGLPLPEELRDKSEDKDYPPALLEFIKRCYENCSSDLDNKRMEAQLRKIIQQAESRLHQVNWAEFEVPQLPKAPQPQPAARPMVPAGLPRSSSPSPPRWRSGRCGHSFRKSSSLQRNWQFRHKNRRRWSPAGPGSLPSRRRPRQRPRQHSPSLRPRRSLLPDFRGSQSRWCRPLWRPRFRRPSPTGTG